MAVTKRQVLKYTLLPGFIPRILDFFRSGFAHIAYLVAVVFGTSGLLPRSHIYLVPENFGRFGVRHVMAEGYKNLVFKRSHADQVLLYFTVLTGLVMLLMQLVILGTSVYSGSAFASGIVSAYELAPFRDWFVIPSANTTYNSALQDSALMALDRIFGVTGIFNSCISTGANCITHTGRVLPDPAAYPYPIHLALHQMLAFYSAGILLVSVIIIIYFFITVVAETARTGTPFGQRYNKAWAPVRLILFFALLVPLNLGGDNAGLNGAQLITLYTAKFGSNLASNGWARFSNGLNNEYLGDVETLIAQPNVQGLEGLVGFMFVAKACQIASLGRHDRPDDDRLNVQPYVVSPSPNFSVAGTTPGGQINAVPSNADFMTNVSFTQALAAVENGNVILRFGERDQNRYPREIGFVSKECGEIVLQTVDAGQPGARMVQQEYYNLISSLWQDSTLTTLAQCLVDKRYVVDPDADCTEWPPSQDSWSPPREEQIQNALEQHIAIQRDQGDFAVPIELAQKGWAGAAIWYNRIAEMNGAVTAAVLNVPRPASWPRVLEEAYQQRRINDDSSAGLERFDPKLSNGNVAEFSHQGDLEIANTLYAGFRSWNLGVSQKPHVAPTGNVIINTINLVFGSAGLFDIRTRNADIHPVAQLSALGRGLVEAALRNILIGGAGIVGEGVGRAIEPLFGELVKVGSSFLFVVAFNIITIGVILFYVLPFLPFIYFLFAVSGWLKSIFEAMVAMPIWALSHVRIDGEGLPGPAATNGYFLLLEILLRPILIVFGLIASISIFSAMVIALNEVFDLVVLNLTGFDTESSDPTSITFYRNSLDEFMFTLIYAVLVYILALSSFKLIDQIPNQILRYAGSNAPTIQETLNDPAGQLSRQVYRGGSLFSQQAQGQLTGAGNSLNGQLATILGT